MRECCTGAARAVCECLFVCVCDVFYLMCDLYDMCVMCAINVMCYICMCVSGSIYVYESNNIIFLYSGSIVWHGSTLRVPQLRVSRDWYEVRLPSSDQICTYTSATHFRIFKSHVHTNDNTQIYTKTRTSYTYITQHKHRHSPTTNTYT